MRCRATKSTPDEDLHKAVISGSVTLAKAALARHANVNEIDPQTFDTPLLSALYHNKTELAALLLKHGANPNIPNDVGATPLTVAMDLPNPSILRPLIEHGANVNYIDPRDRTALILACQLGRTDAVRLLLKAGADIHLKENVYSLLELAINQTREQVDLVKLLIEHGADVNAQIPFENQSPLILALRRRHSNIASLLLLHGASPNKPDEYGMVSIFHATYDLKVLKQLLAYGADIHATGSSGRTLLIQAASQPLSTSNPSEDEQIEVLRFLLSQQLDINATTEDKETALTGAARAGRFKALKFLLTQGVGKEQIPQALLNAARNADTEMVSYLLKLPGLNLQHALLQQALAEALSCEVIEMSFLKRYPWSIGDTVYLLIKAGAVPAETNSKGTTAFLRTCKTIALIYLDTTPFYTTAIEHLLDAGADVNEVDGEGKTALMYAAQRGRRELFEFLLHHGADIHLKDREGKSAYMYAEEYIRKYPNARFDSVLP